MDSRDNIVANDVPTATCMRQLHRYHRNVIQVISTATSTMSHPHPVAPAIQASYDASDHQRQRQTGQPANWNNQAKKHPYQIPV